MWLQFKKSSIKMNVQEIYEQYNIPLNLQKHMLRVTGLSQIILENWQGKKLNKEIIIQACLFHDMANIIKFNLDKPPLFKEEKLKLNYWKKIQRNVIKKYGNNIHQANLQICQEIGLSSKTLTLINNLEWDNIPQILRQNDFEPAHAIYSDMRISPFGIVSLHDRLTNLQTRSKIYDFNLLKKNALVLEKTLQKNISINLNKITEEQINSRFKNLLKIII